MMLTSFPARRHASRGMLEEEEAEVGEECS